MGLAVLPKQYLPLSQLDLTLLRFFCWMSALMTALILIAPIAQNFRYLTPVYGPMYFMGGFGMWALLQLARRHLQGAAYGVVVVAMLAVVITGAARGYLDFERVYVEQGTADLSIKMVLASR